MPGRKSVLFLCPEVPALCCAHQTIQAVPSVTWATQVTPLYSFSHFSVTFHLQTIISEE